jgi:hypothetical protein
MNIQVQLTSTFGGLILQGASMLVLSLCLSWHALEAFSGILSVLGTITYVVAFSLGAGPVPALLLAEIFASRIRPKAISLSLGVHWVFSWFKALSLPVLQ